MGKNLLLYEEDMQLKSPITLGGELILTIS
jgi:hypothetical protein